MSMNVKKKTTIAAVAAVGAAAIALTAGTLAAFSSNQAGPDTALAAGKLDFGTSSNVDVTLSDFVPGTDVKTRTMTFTNDSNSSLSGNVKLAFVLADNLDNGCNGDEVAFDATCADAGGAGELPDKLTVKVTSGETELYNGPLSDLATSTAVSTSNVAAGSSVTYTFEFNLPEGGPADNSVQGDSVKLKTKATLVQS